MSKFDEIAKDRADWLVDAIAGATQNRRYLRGDKECNEDDCEAIALNAEKAIRVAIQRSFQLMANEAAVK